MQKMASLLGSPKKLSAQKYSISSNQWQTVHTHLYWAQNINTSQKNKQPFWVFHVADTLAEAVECHQAAEASMQLQQHSVTKQHQNSK